MTPREMFIAGVLNFNFPGNCYKRTAKIDRLANAIGAEVFYGMNSQTNTVVFKGDAYDAEGLRHTESLLRHLKRNEC